MPTLEKILLEALTFGGALGVAVGDWRSGTCLGAKSADVSALPERDLSLAIAGNSEVLRAKLKVAEALAQRLKEIIVVCQEQYHLIWLVNSHGLFIYLVLDLENGNLALARIKLEQLAEQLRQLPLKTARF
ncbi:hypothetical protein [Synechococcus sp. H55.11]|uniref:hypothetical protein n=1 Tax=unclassified Synechococcus TaxID=2626047 RepID=UPI0039C0D860